MRVQLKVLALSTLTTLMLANANGHAQTNLDDISAACSAAGNLVTNNDINAAYEEAQWCFESVRQLRQQQTIAVFPDAIDGFIGDEVDDSSAMGMTIIERSYSKGDQRLNVLLGVGGTMSAIANMASTMMVPGITKRRVGSFTVWQMPNDDEQYLIGLDGNASITITSYSVDADKVMDFIRQFPIEQLERSIG